MHTISNVLWPI